MGEPKEPVRLRGRKLPTGNTSLYLDIYINDKRSCEYLKSYLVPEKTRSDKEKNCETMSLIYATKSKRAVEPRNGELREYIVIL